MFSEDIIPIFAAISLGLVICFMCLYLFNSQTTLYHSEKCDFAADIRNCCPYVFDYWPTLWLWNGHFQTVFAAFYKPPYSIDFHRMEISATDGASFSIDLSVDYKQSYLMQSASKLIVVLHGLTGGSRDQYVQALCKQVDNTDTVVAVVLARGCGDTTLKTPVPYCGAWTADIRQAVKVLHEWSPKASMILVGFSLGANILVNYLGEEAENVLTCIKGAISVGAPYDMFHCAVEMQNSTLHRLVYSRRMALGLKQLAKRFQHLFDDHPEVNIEEVLSESDTLWDFDAKFTSKIFGYSNAAMYYREASSIRKIGSVRLPLVCLNAYDDPVVPGKTLLIEDFRHNSNVILILTSKGGHIGWFTGNFSPDNSWCSRVIQAVSNYFLLRDARR
jgi:uncharacterized protein